MGAPEKKKYYEGAEEPQQYEYRLDESAFEIEAVQSFFQNLKDLFYNLLGKRKYRRRRIDYTSNLRTVLMLEGRRLEVIPIDIGRGGIGLRIPRQHLLDFQVEQKVRLEVVFKQNQRLELEGEVRYILKGEMHGSIGIKFTQTPELFEEALRAHGIRS